MKFLILHTGSKERRTKLIINPWSVAFCKQKSEDGFNSFVFAANTAFMATETVDEIEKLLEDCCKTGDK